jgi:hypothetical protein
MGATKRKDGHMPALQLRDLHRSKDSNILPALVDQEASSSSMDLLLNNTTSTKTSTTTATMMVVMAMGTIRDMANSMMI